VLKTELSIDISPSLNPKILRIFDTSHYCNHEDIENYIVEILPVNKSKWITFHVSKGFSLALNSSNLLYRKVGDESGLIPLPDGIYEIKQSIKPNLYTVQLYYHLRTVEFDRKIKTEREKLLSGQCSISRDDFMKNRDALREIEEYVLAAKWKVEECNEKKEGIELYKYAEKLLENYTNECQC
jgi:hypothetical protein